MALNNNFKWFGAGLVTAFVATSVYMNFIKPMEFSVSTAGSDRIEWDDANTLREEYEDFKHMRTIYVSSSTGRDTTPILKGFVFDAAHLDEVINNNRSSLGDPDKVIFYLGQEGSFRTGFWPFSTHYPSLHLIAAGIRNDTLLNDYSGRPNDASLFDKADPCPPNCPDYTSYP